ncbi:TIGR02281 family clan AA aspartic protease, partial [Wolbachia endosymbiont of Drosophila ananassae]
YLFRSPCLPYSATPLNGYVQDFKIYETAKGQIKAGVVQIPQVKIGNFLINDVQASVNTHSMSHSLLGMSFLRYFHFTIRDNKLILYRD